MLFTAYSARSGISEIRALIIRHISIGRMQIFVENTQVKKDRYVNVSPVLLDILESYIKSDTPQPKEYLFESEQTGIEYFTPDNSKNIPDTKRQSGG